MGIKDFKPSKKSKFKQGYYRVINTNKYVGNFKKVIYRSSYELKFFKELDLDKNVVKWVAEPEWLRIKYPDPLSGKTRSYYPDVYCEKLVDGVIKKFVIEVKSKAFITKPKASKPVSQMSHREKLSYNKRMYNYMKNMKKKDSCVSFCESNNMTYIFITETYLKLKK